MSDIVKDIYVGVGETCDHDLIINDLAKMGRELHKADRLRHAAAHKIRMDNQAKEPKVPCPGLLGTPCGNLKPESAGVCGECQEEYHSDPDAYK